MGKDKDATSDNRTFLIRTEDIAEERDGELIPKKGAVVSSQPTAFSVPTTSVTASWVEQYRLVQVRKETEKQGEVARAKTELNVAIGELVESEIHKGVAVDRLHNIDDEKAKVKARHDVDNQIADAERNTELNNALRRLAKSEGKLEDQEEANRDAKRKQEK